MEETIDVQPTIQDIPTDESYKILSSKESNDIKDKLVKIREYLASQEFKEDVLVLPNVFTNECIRQGRFYPYYVKDDQFLMMVNRASIVEPMAQRLNESEDSITVTLYGPQGCGKSFVVYQLVTRLMKDKNNFVVYINKAYNSLVHDLIYTIAAQLPDDEVKQILEKCGEQLIGTFGEDSVRTLNFFLKVEKYLKSQNRDAKMIFVIDQVESISCKDIFNFLLQLECYHCVFAGSGNNMPHEFEHTNDPVSEELLRFTEDQFRAMCVIYERQKISKTNAPQAHPLSFQFSKGEIAQIMSLTGGLPLYITGLLLEYGSVGNLATAISISTTYLKLTSLNQCVISQYYKSLSTEDKPKALENIQKLFLNEQIEYENVFYDKRFIYLSESGKLRAVNPIAFQSLFYYFSSMLK